MKRALITGIAGQDGSYLAELLVEKGYAVSGVVRHSSNTENLESIQDKLELITGDVLDEAFVRSLVAQRFDEIYSLASVATTQGAWADPVGVVRSAGVVPMTFLESIRLTSRETKFFQASSAEIYGDPVESPQSERTLFHPNNPYGYGKLLAHQAVDGYRSQHDLFAVSGILFNHESPRRTVQFVTRKITNTLARIAKGADEVLCLGNLDSVRDWSYVGDIVRGMWLSLQQEKADSYVFASGEVHTVREFVDAAATAVGMSIVWEGAGVEEKGKVGGKVVVAVDPAFFRPAETRIRQGDITKASRELQWRPEVSFTELVTMMVRAEK
jgi:GDPmannose 4,6-dehydratase